MAEVAPNIPAVEVEIVEMTNAYRAKHSLSAVQRNSKLDTAAENYAKYLGKTGKFSHEADGKGPGDRAKAAGYNFCKIAENLGVAVDSRGFTTEALAKQFVQGWIESPGHRKNLLAPNVTEIGVGVVRAPHEHPKYVSVQLFGRPISEKYTFQITNSASQSVQYSFAGETHQIGPRYTVKHEACEPGEITFGPGNGKVQSSYQASDGTVYAIRQVAGEIEIDVKSGADQK